MSRKATLIATGVLGAVILSLLVVESRLSANLAQQPVQAPAFEVDPFWPKPLPNNWVIGSTIGVGVDSRDHVYIVHRDASLNARTEIGAAQTPPTGECCVPALTPRVHGNTDMKLDLAHLERRGVRMSH